MRHMCLEQLESIIIIIIICGVLTVPRALSSHLILRVLLEALLILQVRKLRFREYK